MLRLNRYVLALVAWLSFVFNVERLDLNISSPDLFNISFPMYIALVAVAVAGLLVPQRKKLPLTAMLLVGALAFVTAASLDDRPAWGGGYTYLSFFELSAMLITASLAYIVGRLTAEFLETARTLIFPDTSGRVYGPKEADSLISLQMRSSRRTNRALSVVLIDVNIENAQVALQATAKEIQQLLVKRYSLASLNRLLTKTIRRTDFVLDRSKDGQLVLIAPEMSKQQALALIERLDKTAQRRLGVSVSCGVASFPQQGATFEELLYQAEQDLHPTVKERYGDELIDRREATPEPRVVSEAMVASDLGVQVHSR